jgi:hypothetical protein
MSPQLNTRMEMPFRSREAVNLKLMTLASVSSSSFVSGIVFDQLPEGFGALNLLR